jgi:hypothetical protein
MGIVAAYTINIPSRHGIHIGTHAHAVDMGFLYLFMALQTERNYISYEEFWLVPGMGGMATPATLFQRLVFICLCYHLSIMTIETEFRWSFVQEVFCKGRVR